MGPPPRQIDDNKQGGINYEESIVLSPGLNDKEIVVDINSYIIDTKVSI